MGECVNKRHETKPNNSCKMHVATSVSKVHF